jgi:predicted ATPase
MSIRIQRLRVERLFGRHTYDIDLTKPITIITSPNGFGKTTLLNFLQIAADKAFYKFKTSKYVFDSVTYFFSDESYLKITHHTGTKKKGRNPEDYVEIEIKIIVLEYTINGATYSFQIADDFIDAERLDARLRDELNSIVRIGEFSWRDTMSGEIYSYDQALALISTEGTLGSSIFRRGQYPEWLKNINVKSLSINANRLEIKQLPPDIGRYSPGMRTRLEREVRSTSVISEISERVKRAYADVHSRQFNLSREKESTFVTRLLDSRTDLVDTSLHQLETMREEIKKYQSLFQKLNLSKSTASQETPLPSDTHYWAMIRLYYEDMLSRFREIEPIAIRLDKFIETLNRMNENTLHFETSAEGIKVAHDYESTNIDLFSLSSGQQHLLVLFGKLFFDINNDTIVFVDEPEISLHGAWQLEFIDIINNAVSGFSNVQIVIATHSPLIYSRFIESDEIIELSSIDENQK